LQGFCAGFDPRSFEKDDKVPSVSSTPAGSILNNQRTDSSETWINMFMEGNHG